MTATELRLPRLGQGMESGTIVRWLKGEGETVGKGEPLYELDTDKVTQEVEADAGGVLVKIVVAEGEVQVGETIALIEQEAGSPSAPPESSEAPPSDLAAAPSELELRPAEPEPPGAAPPGAAPPGAAPPGAAPPGAAPPGAAPPPVPPASTPRAGRVKASPLARRIARERGLDLATVPGTGPDGRVVADDVEKAAVAGPPAGSGLPGPPPDVEIVELTSVRRTIARRLTEAWQAPVFQLGVTVDMTELVALRERLVERLVQGDAKPSVGDVLTRLVAVALGRHPALNATFDGERIQRFASADVGIAVAAPGGLVVPVLRAADRSSIHEIARQRADLVGRARAGKLALGDLQGGTFTISNLGMYGVEHFVAVLNPPQVAILAVGAVRDAPIVIDGELDVAPQASLTLTCDHRAIDGADGAEFLRTVVSLVEHPALAL